MILGGQNEMTYHNCLKAKRFAICQIYVKDADFDNCKQILHKILPEAVVAEKNVIFLTASLSRHTT